MLLVVLVTSHCFNDISSEFHFPYIAAVSLSDFSLKTHSRMLFYPLHRCERLSFDRGNTWGGQRWLWLSTESTACGLLISEPTRDTSASRRPACLLSAGRRASFPEDARPSLEGVHMPSATALTRVNRTRSG